MHVKLSPISLIEIAAGFFMLYLKINPLLTNCNIVIQLLSFILLLPIVVHSNSFLMPDYSIISSEFAHPETEIGYNFFFLRIKQCISQSNITRIILKTFTNVDVAMDAIDTRWFE